MSVSAGRGGGSSVRLRLIISHGLLSGRDRRARQKERPIRRSIPTTLRQCWASVWSGAQPWRDSWRSCRCWRRTGCWRRTTLRAVRTATIPIARELHSAAPNDHFIGGPNCRVSSSNRRGVDCASRYPRVGTWIVSIAGIRLAKVVSSAPDDHFSTGPDCGVPASVSGRIAGSYPTIRAWIVSPAGVQNPSAISTPNDHLITAPNRSMC